MTTLLMIRFGVGCVGERAPELTPKLLRRDIQRHIVTFRVTIGLNNARSQNIHSTGRLGRGPLRKGTSTAFEAVKALHLSTVFRSNPMPILNPPDAAEAWSRAYAGRRRRYVKCRRFYLSTDPCYLRCVRLLSGNRQRCL